MLVLHGFAGSARSMAPMVTRLAERHRVLALDLVGHGRSDAPREAAAYAWPAVTRQLQRVLDALDVEHAHLLGFSLGGRIALQLAARHAERVRSALVVGGRCAVRSTPRSATPAGAATARSPRASRRPGSRHWQLPERRTRP